MSDQRSLFPDATDRKFRLIVASVFPPGMHTYQIHQAFVARGHHVFTAGLGGDTSDFNGLMRSQYPDYTFDLITRPNTPANEIVAAAGGADLLLFVEPHRAYLPWDIEDCEIPTLFLMGDDLINADWGLPLYDRFDVGLTSVHAHFRRYQSRGLDHVRWWHCWAAPGYVRDLGLPRTQDFVFVGNVHPVIQRARTNVIERVTALRDEGFGINVQTGTWFDGYNRAINRGKTTYAGNLAGHFAMRVFESMVAGCLVIAPPPEDATDPIAAAFQHERDIVFAATPDEVVAGVRHYARDEDARQTIVTTAQRTVAERFTYPHSIDRFVRDVASWIPSDFRERRRARLARIGDSDESRRGVRAAMAVALGDAGTAAGLLDGVAPAKRDAGWLNARGVTQAVAGRRDAGVASIANATQSDPSNVAATANLATVSAHHVLLDGAAPDPTAIEFALERLDHVDLDNQDLLDGAVWYATGYDRPRMEMASAFIQLAAGPDRNRRVVALLRFRLHSLAAAIHARDGNVAAAARHLERAVEILPDDGYTRAALGEVRAAQGRLRDGADELELAAHLEPFHADAQLKLANLRISTDRAPQAADAMRRLLDCSPILSEPERAQAWALLGIAAARSGDLDQARRALQASLALAPDQVAIRDFLAGLPTGGARLAAALPT